MRTDGFVFAYTRAMAVNPEAHQAFEALIARDRAVDRRAHVRARDARRRARHRLAALPARARPQDAARGSAVDEDQLARVARDDVDADLDERDVAVMAFAEKLSTDAAADDGRRLRAACARSGFTDRRDRRHHSGGRGAQLLQPRAAGAGRAGRRRSRTQRRRSWTRCVCARSLADASSARQWWMSAFNRISTPPKAAVITALRMRGSQWVLQRATAIQPSAPSSTVLTMRATHRASRRRSPASRRAAG